MTSKIHAVVGTNGLPVRLGLTAGEAHDNRLALKLLSRLKSGAMLLADRGYDADWIRAVATKKRAWANIPPRCNRKEPICFSPHLYRARNLVERFFNKINNVGRSRRAMTSSQQTTSPSSSLHQSDHGSALTSPHPSRADGRRTGAARRPRNRHLNKGRRVAGAVDKAPLGRILADRYPPRPDEYPIHPQ